VQNDQRDHLFAVPNELRPCRCPLPELWRTQHGRPNSARFTFRSSLRSFGVSLPSVCVGCCSHCGGGCSGCRGRRSPAWRTAGGFVCASHRMSGQHRPLCRLWISNSVCGASPIARCLALRGSEGNGTHNGLTRRSSEHASASRRLLPPCSRRAAPACRSPFVRYAASVALIHVTQIRNSTW
jgi:hypothetical protein